MHIVQAAVVMFAVWGLTSGASAQSPVPSDRLATIERQLMAVIDEIVEHHVDPPTRQQLVLDSLRRAATAYEKDLPAGLAREISAASPESLSGVLQKHLRQLSAGQAAVFSELWQGRMRTDGASGVREPGRATKRPLRLSDLLPPDVHATSTEANRVNEQLAANRYVGIGIRLTVDKETRRSQMAEVLPNGPAQNAGAQDGDLIMQIDGDDTQDKSITEVVQMLRGPKGSVVELVLQQPGEKELRTYVLTRGVVPIANVSDAAFSSDRRAVGIRIKQISASTVHELRKIEAKLQDDNRLVVLDVRFLRSHHLHHGTLLASALLDGGVVGSVDSATGNRQISAEPGRLFPGRQLALLIAPTTSGTIEWVAASLQDQQQAILVGTPTAGRAFVLETVPTAYPNLLVQIPTGRLRRADGRRLYGPPRQGPADLRSVELRSVEGSVRAVEAAAKFFSGRPKSPPKTSGVEPDIGDIVWRGPSDGPDSTQSLVHTVERVVKLVLDNGVTATPESGD